MKHLNKYEHTTVIKGTKSRPNTAAILVELDANFYSSKIKENTKEKS